jgi:hypothetical protein
MGAAGEGARASRVHDSAEFGVLAMTMWRFDPAAGPSAADADQVQRAQLWEKTSPEALQSGLNDFQALRVGVTPNS